MFCSSQLLEKGFGVSVCGIGTQVLFAVTMCSGYVLVFPQIAESYRGSNFKRVRLRMLARCCCRVLLQAETQSCAGVLLQGAAAKCCCSKDALGAVAGVAATCCCK